MSSRVLSLIGPPGSGKGTYGRILAKALDLSLIGMSDVLRKTRPDVSLSCGGLVDDSMVVGALLEYLQNQPSVSNGYLLDGFPRTHEQIQLLLACSDSSKSTEEGGIEISGAILLDVPDYVCITKSLGRRLCTRCQGNFNIHAVDREGWNLPPTLPTPITAHKPHCSQDHCGDHWQTRPDDDLEVMRDRLHTYHKHMDPIVQTFESQQKLLKLVPYKGYEEVPDMIQHVRSWLSQFEHWEGVVEGTSSPTPQH